MKKSELKNIIKECVKEVIFEEGVLSGIISEVATGLRGTTMTVVQETKAKTSLRTPESQAFRRVRRRPSPAPVALASAPVEPALI